MSTGIKPTYRTLIEALGAGHVSVTLQVEGKFGYNDVACVMTLGFMLSGTFERWDSSKLQAKLTEEAQKSIRRRHG